uniref:PAS domain S-box protein n=1 Tax=Desulfatirhabdium butyrativorans TaxID=340467 RepID=A0A7C4RRK6_9BACT
MVKSDVSSDIGDSKPSYYVGIGASAGGLEAIESFFMNMPSNSGLAFIVVQHLSPDYKSLMVELLSKKTEMAVHRAEDGLLVQPNQIYLIPPKKNLTIFHGKLLLKDQEPSRSTINLPIDIFLRSLAEDQAERAIAVILSGTGSDGTRGVRAIKENGGMVMIQSPESARFDGMPRAAISTGVADFVLSPEDMPAQLMAFIEHPYGFSAKRSETILNDEDGLNRIFAELRSRTQVDFTYYKPSTITRRIERRMTVNQIDDLQDYVAFLYAHPGEVMTLYRELLIGVTSFFRDPEAMNELADNYLPKILLSKTHSEIRFWVAGCSTGEEAYTIAILAREVMEREKISRDVKIFATDIDKNAIVSAGNGVYPESIAADLTPKLLGKYFYRKGDDYQIARHIREMVVFAQHNLVKDPPFTNIELISCRNLLIYLQPVLQKKALEMFHYSLNPDGILFLGTSETVGEMIDCFEPLHARWKIFRSKGKGRGLPSDFVPVRGGAGTIANRVSLGHERRRVTDPEEVGVLRRFLELVSMHFIPLSLIVNEAMQIVHIVGNTEGYLIVPSGKVDFDIPRMAVKDIAIPLATGIQKVFRTREPIVYSNIRMKHKDGIRNVTMRILPMPLRKGQDPMVAVFFSENIEKDASDGETASATYDIGEEARQRIQDLEQELQIARENLQATIEELETSNEELQATNEELLASNEELQSTNEELQSTNEELYTVNTEYQNKILELTELQNDVDNLLTSSRIGTLLLDENLDIRKYSPEISRLFHVLETDIGRNISHLAHRILDFDPVKAAGKVQRSERPMEQEVRTEDGTWYLVRILPYRIGANRYSGIVMTFVDISQLKKTTEALRETRTRYRALFETMAQGVVYQDRDGHIIDANPAAERILGLSIDQMKGRTSMDPRWKAVREDGTPLPGELHPAMVALRTGKPVLGYVMGVYSPKFDGHRWILVNATPEFKPGESEPFRVYATFEDMTDRLNIGCGACRSLKEEHTSDSA